MPFPPDYPKMPGEPPRVQPSKKVEEHWDADGNWIGTPSALSSRRASAVAEMRKGPPGASPRAPGREPFAKDQMASSPDEPHWVGVPRHRRWRSFPTEFRVDLALPPECAILQFPQIGSRRPLTPER